MTPNRVATLMAIVASVLTAIVPAVANMDWTSTAGVLAGGFGVVVAIVKWLQGWQNHEQHLQWEKQMGLNVGVADQTLPEPTE